MFFIFVALIFPFFLHAQSVEYKVDADATVAPYTVKIKDQLDQFSAELKSFQIDDKGKTSSQNLTVTLKKDALNPPLYWDEKKNSFAVKQTLCWGYRLKDKHIICLASFSASSFLTLSHYEEISPQKFKLTIIADPHLKQVSATETNIAQFLGNYVGRGDVTVFGGDQAATPQRDIDFSLKTYSRGFELIKSLIICPEGRDNCTDGKRKSNKYYFKKIDPSFFVEEEKANLFKKPEPMGLQENGYVQWAIWHKGLLKTYMISCEPEHPLILEAASWAFGDKNGEYNYIKYIDAKLHKKVTGKFFKAKVDEEYSPQTQP